MNIFVYRQGTTNCLVSHKTIMAIHNKGYMPADTPIFPAFCEDSGRPSIMARRRQAVLRLSPCLTGHAGDLPKNHPGSNPGYLPARLIPWTHAGMEENNE